MKLNPVNKSALKTGQIRPVVAGRIVDKLLGLEKLDLSVANPKPTAHFKLSEGDGAWFQREAKGSSYGDAWQLGARGKGLQLELQMPSKHGVVLILEMSRTTYTESDQPVIFSINDEEWPLELDPKTLKFYQQSWYLPHFYLEEGENRMGLRLAADAQTNVLVKSVAVMRFEIEKQRRGNWCWAAVTNSLLSFFDAANERTQCDLVKECFGRSKEHKTETNCCEFSRRKECNRTFKLVDALDNMGLSSSRCNYPLSLSEIREQINQGAPVGVRIGWKSGGGHFVVITAVGPPDPRGESHTWLRIADPKDPAASYLTYRTLKSRYKGEGSWTHSYLFERERLLHP